MVRLAIGVCILATLIWFCGVYRLGDKTLVGHVDEIYKSPLVQKKVDQLREGFDNTLDDFAVERSRQESTKRRVQARAEQRSLPREKHSAPLAPLAAEKRDAERTPVDVRPSQVKKVPPRDALTDDDRHDLDKLLSDKLR